MKEWEKGFVSVFAFLFPLTAICWGLKDLLSPETKKTAIEGLYFNFFFLLLVVFLKYLAFIPIVGIVFYIFYSVVIRAYFIIALLIIFLKVRDINFEIPFFSFYAEKSLRD